jgi:ribosomal protein S18 acetylase RimI-like enzyme
MNMDLRIRNAERDDAAFLAWVMLTAGRAHVKRGIWEVILDKPEDQCLKFLEHLAVTETPHLFHHSCYLVAELANRSVAGLGGYDPNTLGYPVLQEALPEVFKKMSRDTSEEVMPSGPPKIVGCVPPAIEGAWVIDSVATLPEFRRRGIVSRLLDDMLQRGREKGFRSSQINVYIGNTPAQCAYEKHGFKIIDEWRDPYFESKMGSPGMARMFCDL